MAAIKMPIVHVKCAFYMHTRTIQRKGMCDNRATLSGFFFFSSAEWAQSTFSLLCMKFTDSTCVAEDRTQRR